MTTVEHTGRSTGPATLHIETQTADIEVVSDPRISGTWIELATPDSHGAAVDAIRNAAFRDNGDTLHLVLKEPQNSGVFVSGNNFGNISIGRNNRVTVNGMTVTGSSGAGPITVRAMLAPGSALVAKTMSGSITTKGVAVVNANTMSGDIESDGVSGSSQLKSMSGSIRVYGTGRPFVVASTMSGDVVGEGVDLSASSMSGRVRQR